MDQWSGDVNFVQGRPRHSQSQGLVESGNRTVEDRLAVTKHDLYLAEDDVFHWAKYLPQVMHSLNIQISETTSDTPYHLVFGQSPQSCHVPGLGSRILDEAQLEQLVDNPVRDPVSHEKPSADVSPVDATLDDVSPVDETLADVLPVDATLTDVPPVDATLDDVSPVDAALADVSPVDAALADVSPVDTTLADVPPIHRHLVSASGSEDEGPVSTQDDDVCIPAPMIAHNPDQTPVRPATKPSRTTFAVRSVPPTCHDVSADIRSLTPRERAHASTVKNAKRMENFYNKKTRVTTKEFDNGDRVSVQIPKNERTSTDVCRIPGKIIDVRGSTVVSYQIATTYGVLKSLYRAGDLQDYHGDIQVNTGSELSLREAAKRMHPTNKFTRKSCKCTSGCQTGRCCCRRNNIECSNHCHPMRASCKNKSTSPHEAPGTSPTNEQKTPADETPEDIWLQDL